MTFAQLRRLLLILIALIATFIVVIISIVFIKFYSSSTQLSEINENIILQLCEGSCWNNIKPGVTTESQTLSILETNILVDPNTLRRFGESSEGRVEWMWRVSNTYSQSVIEWSDGLVQLIGLQTVYSTPIQRFIRSYGDPDGVFAYRLSYLDYAYWHIDVYYSNIGMELGVRLNAGSNDFEINSNVEQIYLYIPSEINSRIENEYSYFNRGSILRIENGIQKWKGYGDIDMYESDASDIYNVGY